MFVEISPHFYVKFLILFTANGDTTYQNALEGIVCSPFYPQSYDKEDFTHTWNLTAPAGFAIQIYFDDLETEACCDIVTVSL